MWILQFSHYTIYAQNNKIKWKINKHSIGSGGCVCSLLCIKKLFLHKRLFFNNFYFILLKVKSDQTLCCVANIYMYYNKKLILTRARVTKTAAASSKVEKCGAKTKNYCEMSFEAVHLAASKIKSHIVSVVYFLHCTINTRSLTHIDERKLKLRFINFFYNNKYMQCQALGERSK